MNKEKYRGKIILYIIAQFVYSGLILLPPYCYLLFLNEVIKNGKMNLLFIILSMFIAVFIAKAFVSVIIKNLYNRVFPLMMLDTKEAVMNKLSNLPMSSVLHYTAGDLKERVHKDTENAVLFYEKRIEVFVSIISIVITTGMLLYLNWILACISFLLLPLSFYITSVIKKKNNKQYEHKRELESKYNDFMIHNMFFWKEVKSNCLEQAQEIQFRKWWDALGDAF